MELLPEQPEIKTHRAMTRVSLYIAGTVGLLLVLVIASAAYADMSYEAQVFPGVSIGTIPLGGLKQSEVETVLRDVKTKLNNDGIRVSAEIDGTMSTITLNPASTTVNDALVTFSPEQEAVRAVQFGKQGNFLLRGVRVLFGYVSTTKLPLSTISVREDMVVRALSDRFSATSSTLRDADFRITSIKPFAFEIIPARPGVGIDYAGVGQKIAASWQELKAPDITLPVHATEPTITTEALQAAAPHAESWLIAGPLTLAFSNPSQKQHEEWSISLAQLASWMQPIVDPSGEITFTLKNEPVISWLDKQVRPAIEVAPHDGHIVLNETKTRALEFVGDRPGITVDKDATYKVLAEAFRARGAGEASSTVQLVVSTVTPQVSIGSQNDLGIKEVLGSGYSNFSNSPKNRILNIKNAVKNKLQGTIVQPGQEFSLVQTLKPFTLESGYLPELVIVGNRIKPEVAGGLCQVGTTMFRSVMNSGLPVTARTNHGLVVSYYNDPRNGNPGTDATIYDGWPDFKFKNDTATAILIDTDMNTTNGNLVFTLWGTNDGRTASYTAPQVSQWIPAGPAETIETSDLAPGKKECQGVHNGAIASFVYHRVLAGGEKIDQEFKSVYRAVPATCFVGKSAPCVPAADGSTTCPVPAAGTSPTVPGTLSTETPIVPNPAPAVSSPPVPLSE